MSGGDSNSGGRVRVWDLPVRVMHWTLLALIIGAWLTRKLEGDWFAWHERIGYAVAVIVTTRIIWGVVGTRHARFSDFLRGPGVVFNFLRSEGAAHFAGHNPAGGWMVLWLIALLGMQVLTGLFANDQVSETGPLFGYVTVGRSDALTTLHKIGFLALQWSVVLHVAAVFWHRWVRGENLVRPMIDGHKPRSIVPADAPGIEGSRGWLAIVIAAGAATILWWLVRNAPAASLYAF